MEFENLESFDSQVKVKIQKMQDENANLQKKIEPLIHQIEENKRKIQSLTSYLAIEYEKKPISNKIKPTKEQASSVPDVIEQIFKRLNREAHRSELLELVKKEGVIIGGKKPSSTLSAHLSNDARFTKGERRGFWKLKEKDSAPHMDDAESKGKAGDVPEGFKGTDL